MHCPYCNSEKVKKNGSNGVGTAKFMCKSCDRQFVEDPRKGPISEETKGRIDKLLLEKIPLAGIARSMDVSERWLQDYANAKYAEIPRQVAVKKSRKDG